ncbi:MAG: hypothetical protein GY723_12630 [bacterium]|nr:hypothetical protein [bacterium]MCP5065396.1 hypothetical protein [bacterium]
MAWHGFGRTILFGGLAAAGWPAVALLLRPIAAPGDALAIYLLTVASVYVAGLGPSPRRALGAGLLAAFMSAGVLVLASGLGSVVAGAVAVLAVGRVRLFRAGGLARTLTVEGLTLGVGLLLARFIAGPDPMHVALALWAFFLPQSLYFLVGGLTTRHDPIEGLDPFETAHHRAEALLDA